MKTTLIAMLGACAALSACGGAPPAPAGPTVLAYVCEGGEPVHAVYRVDRSGLHSALVTYRNETWNMPASGPQGRFATQNRQWQVGVAPGREEGVLTALGAASSAPIARCRRTGTLSTVAATLPPPGTTPDCAAANLSLKFVHEDAGAGQRWDAFAVANHGPTACAVQGFARVELLGDSGQPVTNVSVRQSLQAGPDAGPAQRLELKPGAQAVFYMHWTPIQSGSETCPKVGRLQVTTPGGRTGLIPLEATPCGGKTTLTPLRKAPGASAAGERG